MNRTRILFFTYRSSFLLVGIGLILLRDHASWAIRPESGRSPIPLTMTKSSQAETLPRWMPDPIELQPQFSSFNSQRLDQQIQLYRQYVETTGIPDVLIVGSSRSLQGIDPTVLQTALEAQGYSGLRVYNFGVNGATAQVVDLIVRQVIPPEHLPRVIVWGDGSRAFNSGRQDLTYNSIVASTGYQQMNQGDRPIVPQQHHWSDAISPFPDCLDSDPDWRADARLRSLTSRATDSCRMQRSLMLPPIQTFVRERMPPPRLFADLDNNGFEAIATQFDPATYYQHYPRVPGAYDDNYVPFDLTGVQTQATVQLAQYLRSQRVPLLFINLPLTQDYLDPVRRQYETQFQQFIQALAVQEGFLVRDLRDDWATQPSFFADPSHLNQSGARAVAQRLAEDDAIPWSRLLVRRDPSTESSRSSIIP